MKIGGNEQINNVTLNASNEVSTNKQNEISIGDYLVQNSAETNSNSINGKTAEVVLSPNIKKSVIPGFTKQNIAVRTLEGVEFNVTLHVQANTNKEQVKELSDKLCKVISNLPPQVLSDMKEETRHITICPNIIHRKDAKAMAVGELNQIFLSAELLAGTTEKDLEETLIHEQGHLIDRREGTFAGKWSTYCQKDFDAVKELATSELGFEVDLYTLSNTRECFADYYLYKCGKPSDEHESKVIFEKLEYYSNEVASLSNEELQATYGENTDKVKDIAKKWKILRNNFDFLLTGTQSGKYPRLVETAQPLSIESMLEINEKARLQQEKEDNAKSSPPL